MGLCGSRCPWQKHVRILLTKDPGDSKFCLEIQRNRRGNIVISAIPPDSKLARWSEAHPYKDVQVGDWVVSVNGALGPRTILQMWATANMAQDSVWLLVKRDPERAQRQMGSKSTMVQDFLETLPEMDLDAPDRGATLEAEGADQPCAGDRECAVCLEPLRNGEKAVQLHCGHAFHFDCAEAYLSHQSSVYFSRCPVCRCDVVDRKRTASKESECPAPVPEAPAAEAVLCEECGEEDLAWF